eukprot:CAMPEP_0119327064 /NCGR_PEP_ID=MMETSP1333-20130426/69838_1 /TAXON_ID=418940 /ORGANISM="Scyphosphaera apsteinii, Strain RCC1455" /LENGTH=414 /DNA_ID=CAMNT_0007335541 /DNA_START=168 /DNA_END=1412 /DNA_ORIENTATION=-
MLYSALVLVATISALVLRYYNKPMRVCVDATGGDCDGKGWTSEHTEFTYSLCGGADCAGQWAVYRISFSLMGLFLVLLLCTWCKSSLSVYIHQGFWFAKVLGFAGVLVGTLFAPNDVFAYYAWVARFIAPAFLIYQSICFIDFGYTINTKWVEKDEQESSFLCFGNSFDDGGRWWKRVLVITSLFAYAVTFVGVGMMFHFFPQDCAFNPLAIITTLVMALLNTVISLSKIAPHGALFTSALVSIYCTWLSYSAISSMPYLGCNPTYGSEGLVKTIINMSVAAITMLYFSLVIGKRYERENGLGGLAKSAVAHDQVSVSVPAEKDDKGETPDPQSFWTYHIRMFVLSVYLAMVLTNWGEVHEQDDGTSESHTAGRASAWVKISTGWLCSLLYLWTLIAPFCFPDREFGGVSYNGN